MYRINHAYSELRLGKTAAATAMDAGYDSLSGFGYTYKKLMGQAPSKQGANVVLMSRLTTPLGPMLVCATDAGICLLEFTSRKMLETEFADLQKRLNASILVGENAHIKQLKAELDQYFSGKRKRFDVPLDEVGTDFQKQVWQALKGIGYGETISYKQEAERLGRPKAYRAVANANGCNKIAIIIPCHRVIASDGTLGGYGGGVEKKRWLLTHEHSHA